MALNFAEEARNFIREQISECLKTIEKRDKEIEEKKLLLEKLKLPKRLKMTLATANYENVNDVEEKTEELEKSRREMQARLVKLKLLLEESEKASITLNIVNMNMNEEWVYYNEDDDDDEEEEDEDEEVCVGG